MNISWEKWYQKLRVVAPACGVSDESLIRAIKLTRLELTMLQRIDAERALELIAQDLEQQVLEKEEETFQ